ncbi:transmembrane gamma-carboxyglutamic acid protein 1 [Scleropages formosus]|uniref:Proline rich Gla (G-carboxyglutamic acid) 1 n=1 Tax=Scleropages formosus TaxID=113540 RepID=A0A8C9WG33_SCLFO|nr:transmembrane gamma-carboxyglutamic acid protein 1 [Scleropages formosus]
MANNVFLPPTTAHGLLLRRPRANSLLEEIKEGNIQRECREEVCSYEEAREVFENNEKTRRFWEEYVRESSPKGNLGVAGLQSLYLVLPLLVGLLLIAVVMVAVWRCQSRKVSQRRSAAGHAHGDPGLSLVVLDPRGRSRPPDPAPPPRPEPVPKRVGPADPPPSYEEAVGCRDVQVHVDPPPPYDDIVTSGSAGPGE